jgi:hypothetical protein
MAWHIETILDSKQKELNALFVISRLVRAVVLNLWVATQHWAVGNISIVREYLIKITSFLF